MRHQKYNTEPPATFLASSAEILFCPSSQKEKSLPKMQFLQAGISQVIISSLVDISLRLNLVVVRQAVNFMDEHFEVDFGVYAIGPWYR